MLGGRRDMFQYAVGNTVPAYNVHSVLIACVMSCMKHAQCIIGLALFSP